MKKLLLCLLSFCLFACSPTDNSNNSDVDNNNQDQNDIQDVVDNNNDLSEYPDCYKFVQDFLNFFNTNYPEYEVKLVENSFYVHEQKARHEEDHDKLFIGIKAKNSLGNEMHITFTDFTVQYDYRFDGITFSHDSLITPEEKEFVIAICHALGFDINNQDSLATLNEGLNKLSNNEYEGTTMAYLDFEADKTYFTAQRIEGNDGTNRYSLYIYR